VRATRGAGVVRFAPKGGPEVVRARCSGCGDLGPEAAGALAARARAAEAGWEVDEEARGGSGPPTIRCRCPSCAAR
jgi:hypothetical protein